MARILVVDDDEVIRASIARMLTCEGHEVAVAKDGKDGCLQCYRTQFDLVICDLFMPDKDGIETIRELRASALKIPIICLTGGGSYRDVTGVDSGDLSSMIRAFGATQTIANPTRLALSCLTRTTWPAPRRGTASSTRSSGCRRRRRQRARRCID